jgi:hypothetical protein
VPRKIWQPCFRVHTLLVHQVLKHWQMTTSTFDFFARFNLIRVYITSKILSLLSSSHGYANQQI